MDKKLMESYLDYIAGQIIDEDKVVTYKSLSRSLNIHVNTAKQLLYAYLSNEKSKSTFPICATYLVAGKVVDGSFNIAIVNESDLKKAQSNLIQVTSEHVYSVQKGGGLKEIKFLCGIGKELSTSDSPNLVIKYSKNVLKQKEKVKKKSLSEEAENRDLTKRVLGSEEEIVDVAESNKKMKAETCEPSESQKKTSPKGNSEKTQSVKKPPGNIASLFAKASERKKKPGKTEVEPVKNEPKSVGDVNDDEDDSEMKDELKIERGILEKRSQAKESLKKRKIGNKRRRIQTLSDSEESSSDNEEQHLDIDLVEEHPLPVITNLEEEEEKEVKESRKLVSKNKRKKRKVIDKTFMNEDGYLETKKQVVFETDSENEIEGVTKLKEEEKTKIERANDKGKGIQGPKKQSSLLTFFKKS